MLKKKYPTHGVSITITSPLPNGNVQSQAPGHTFYVQGNYSPSNATLKGFVSCDNQTTWGQRQADQNGQWVFSFNWPLPPTTLYLVMMATYQGANDSDAIFINLQ
jgi:hypothetical protein